MLLYRFLWQVQLARELGLTGSLPILLQLMHPAAHLFCPRFDWGHHLLEANQRKFSTRITSESVSILDCEVVSKPAMRVFSCLLFIAPSLK
jgi:hypothetical protein